MKEETLSKRKLLKEEVDELIKLWRPVMGNPQDIEIRDAWNQPPSIEKYTNLKGLLEERFKDGGKKLST